MRYKGSQLRICWLSISKAKYTNYEEKKIKEYYERRKGQRYGILVALGSDSAHTLNISTQQPENTSPASQPSHDNL